jgi:hypothetical protein
MRPRIPCPTCGHKCHTDIGLAYHLVVQHQPRATSRLVCPICFRLGKSDGDTAAHVYLVHGVPSRRRTP